MGDGVAGALAMTGRPAAAGQVRVVLLFAAGLAFGCSASELGPPVDLRAAGTTDAAGSPDAGPAEASVPDASSAPWGLARGQRRQRRRPLSLDWRWSMDTRVLARRTVRCSLRVGEQCDGRLRGDIRQRGRAGSVARAALNLSPFARRHPSSASYSPCFFSFSYSVDTAIPRVRAALILFPSACSSV
jgi:hypothetical protein